MRRVAARAAEKTSPKLDINKLDINEITATLAEKWDETMSLWAGRFGFSGAETARVKGDAIRQQQRDQGVQ